MYHTLLKHFDKPSRECKKWISRYIKFINYCSAKQWSEDDCIEYHHIVPQSWGGSNSRENLIALSYKAHVIAHHLLSKTNDRSMLIAMNVILNHFPEKTLNIFTLSTINSIKKQMAIAKSKMVVNLETREVISTHELGVRYNCSTAIILSCVYNGTKFKDHYWQLKDIVDESSIEDEYQRLISSKQDISKNRSKLMAERYSRPIVNLNTGEVFESAAAAATFYGLKDRTTIANAIRKRCRSAGYFWQWKDIVDESSIQYQLSLYENKHLNYKKKPFKRIVNLSTGEVFTTVNDVTQVLGLKYPSRVYEAIKFRKSIGGYFWQFEDVVNNSSIEQELFECFRAQQDRLTNAETSKQQKIKRIKQKSRPVVRLSDCMVFENANAAAQELGAKSLSIIYNAIRCNIKSMGSYWCYKEDFDKLGLDGVMKIITDNKKRG